MFSKVVSATAGVPPLLSMPFSPPMRITR